MVKNGSGFTGALRLKRFLTRLRFQQSRNSSAARIATAAAAVPPAIAPTWLELDDDEIELPPGASATEDTDRPPVVEVLFLVVE